jgi:diguanylate cyclase (GGDEF)-like protein/PAS domain S-box-containing protein
MADNDQFYRRVLDQLSEGVYFVDRARRITYWNRAAAGISGHEASSVIGRTCYDNILRHTDDMGQPLCLTRCPLAATIEDGAEREVDVYLHHSDGHRVPVKVRATAMRDDQGRITGAIETFRDRSDERALGERVEELERLALLDPLTELGNRRYANMQLERRREEMVRESWNFGLIFVDVDSFKEINDSLGHEAGDRVLRSIARTMTGCVRAYDSVCRWGGDELIAIISHVTSSQLERSALKICAWLRAQRSATASRGSSRPCPSARRWRGRTTRS